MLSVTCLLYDNATIVQPFLTPITFQLKPFYFQILGTISPRPNNCVVNFVVTPYITFVSTYYKGIGPALFLRSTCFIDNTVQYDFISGIISVICDFNSPKCVLEYGNT